MAGKEKPKYAYKEEMLPVRGTDKNAMYYNPNYVLVQGNFETFAENFVASGSGMKLNKVQVKAELESMRNKYVTAHLIPHVSFERKHLLLPIEGNRARLWADSAICKQVRMPVLMPSKQGVYVLIEALLDSPKVYLFYHNDT
jgi:hypothetical protein